MKERLVLAAAFLAFAALGLYPPWNYTYHLNISGMDSSVTRPAPRALIFLPPTPKSPTSPTDRDAPPGYTAVEAGPPASRLDGVALAGGRLIVEWLVVAALGAAGYVLTRRRKP